ncbi:hypothetical protein AN958_06736 [Leucoagaricus sp. SymC.cos]|nr:hypothetical protein AN958_06736 [Leucoagaricus sp. SymC.cos]
MIGRADTLTTVTPIGLGTQMLNGTSGGSRSKVLQDSSIRASFNSGSKPDDSQATTLVGGDSGGWGSNAKEHNSAGWTSASWVESSKTSGDGGWDSNSWGNGAWDSGVWDKNGSTTQQNSSVKTNEPKPVGTFDQSAPQSPSILSGTPAIERLHKRSSPLKTLNDVVTVMTDPTSEVLDDAHTSHMIPSSVPISAIRRARLPLPTRQSQHSAAPGCDVPATDHKQLSPLSPVTPQDWTKIPLSGSIVGLIEHDDVASDASGPTSILTNLEPHELHSKLLKDLLEKGLDTKKILMYTDELRDWIVELDLQKRISATTGVMDQKRRDRETVRRQKQEEVTRLKNATYELELRVTDILDDLQHLQIIQPEKFHETFVSVEKASEEFDSTAIPDIGNMFSESGVQRDVVEKAKEGLRAVDQQSADHTRKTDDLKKHIEVAIQLDQMERWQKEDKNHLEQLSEELAILQNLPNLQPQTSHSSTSIIKPDHFTPYIKSLISDYVAREIKPTLDSIGESVDLDNQQFSVEFNKLVGQVVFKTYDLIQLALKATGLIFQLHPPQM